VLPALKILLRVLLLLALGIALLWRFLEWYNVRLEVMSRGGGRRAPVPTTLAASAPAATPMPPPASPPAPAAPDEDQPTLIFVGGGGAAFLVDRNLYATSESLTDGYGHIYPLHFPSGMDNGAVIVHDRAGSGIALFSTERDRLPSVAPMVLASAASLRQGERVRALYPLPSRFEGRGRPAPGVFGGLRLEGRLVLIDTSLHGAVIPGAPVLDDAGRVVGIVVRRRDQKEDLFVAADHIAELVRRARRPR
jgi:hypothetical protein